MAAIQKRLRGAVLAVTIVAMLTVSGCAWFRNSAQQQQIAYIATVFAATYILTMDRALVGQLVTPEQVFIYRVVHHHRTLEILAAGLLFNLIVQHFNDHRALWWPLPVIFVILHNIPGIERHLRDQDRHQPL
jgi:hypothetical protein